MSVTDETGVCNLALDLLAEAPIASLSDDRRIARWCARNYATARDSLLRKAPWRFAIKLVELPEGAAPAFGFARGYDLPADCLRPLPLTVNGAPEGAIIPSEAVGAQIHTDAAPPLRLRYIFRNEDVTAYPADFTEALSAVLAMKMAHWLTGKSGYFGIARDVWRDALENAVLADAIEGTIPEPDATAWIAERWS